MRIINLTEYGQYPSYTHRTRRFNSFIQNSKDNKSVPGFTSFEMDAKRLERPTTQNNINFLIIKLQIHRQFSKYYKGLFRPIRQNIFLPIRIRPARYKFLGNGIN